MQTILNAMMAKNIFEYILVDTSLNVIDSSEHIQRFLSTQPTVGNNVLEYLPELVGYEDEIEETFNSPQYTYLIESVYKHGYYADISLEHHDKDTLLILLHNITEINLSKQKILQYSNELTLYNDTLEKQIKDKVNEIRKKDFLILQKERMATMGEMISLIAHQ